MITMRDLFWAVIALVITFSAVYVYRTKDVCPLPIPVPVSVQVEPVFPLPPVFPTKPRREVQRLVVKK